MWKADAITVPGCIFGRPFAKRFALCYRSVVCLSCLSVTLVYCGQTVGRIKTKLGLPVGLGPGHTVLGHSLPIFGPYLLRPNDIMDQDATRHAARPRPRRLCLRWGLCSPSPKRGRSPPIFGPCLLCQNGLIDQHGTWRGGSGAPSPIFGPFLLWPNGGMHQDATWYGGRPQPRGLYV